MSSNQWLVQDNCTYCKDMIVIWNRDASVPLEACPKHSAPTKVNMDGQTQLNGTKKDEGKARWDLLPMEVLGAVAEILTNGAKKYAPRNWEKGIAYGRVFAGVMRHLFEWWTSKLLGHDGINHADGKNSHLDHAITGLMFLSAYEKRGFNGSEFDDRPGADGIRGKVASGSNGVPVQ